MISENHEIIIKTHKDLVLPGDNKYWVYDYKQARIDSVLRLFTDYRMLLILLVIAFLVFLAFKLFTGRKLTRPFPLIIFGALASFITIFMFSNNIYHSINSKYVKAIHYYIDSPLGGEKTPGRIQYQAIPNHQPNPKLYEVKENPYDDDVNYPNDSISLTNAYKTNQSSYNVWSKDSPGKYYVLKDMKTVMDDLQYNIDHWSGSSTGTAKKSLDKLMGEKGWHFLNEDTHYNSTGAIKGADGEYLVGPTADYYTYEGKNYYCIKRQISSKVIGNERVDEYKYSCG